MKLLSLTFCSRGKRKGRIHGKIDEQEIIFLIRGFLPMKCAMRIAHFFGFINAKLDFFRCY